MISKYNKLVKLMNELYEKGYEVIDFHSEYQGYGCYIEIGNNKYIEIKAKYEGYVMFLYQHNSKYAHDCANDISLAIESYEDYKSLVKGVYNQL